MLVLAVYLQRLHSLTEWLSLQIVFRGSTAGSPRELLTQELREGLTAYGLLRTHEASEAFAVSARKFEYIRAQNFLNLISDGFVEAREQLRILADHRFEPFAVAVDEALRPGVSIKCINAEPDQYYDISAIDDRLSWESQPSVGYWLVPDQDVRFAMLIFDETSALVYTKPSGRSVCDFTEALWTDNHVLVQELGHFFDQILDIAKRQESVRGSDARGVLSQRRLLLSSARTSRDRDVDHESERSP